MNIKNNLNKIKEDFSKCLKQLNLLNDNFIEIKNDFNFIFNLVCETRIHQLEKKKKNVKFFNLLTWKYKKINKDLEEKILKIKNLKK
jgi:hypothetical protein